MEQSQRPSWSLQTRIVLLAGFVSVTVLAIMAWLGAVSAVKVVENDISERSENEASRLVSTLEGATATSLPPGFKALMAELRELVPSVTRVDLYCEEAEGFRSLVSSSTQGDRIPNIQEQEAFRESQIRSFEVDDGSRRLLFTVCPFSFRDGSRGFLTVTTNLEVVDQIFSAHSQIAIYATLVSVALIVLAMSLVFRSTVYSNVQHLAHVMARFKKGDDSVRASELLPGEFRSLARNLNLMLTELQVLHEEMQEKIDLATEQLEVRNLELEKLNLLLSRSQKRLTQAERLALTGQVTASFAHEIGSPLGAVSTQLQLLLEEPRVTSEIHDRLKMANAEIDRVCGIVESLLSTTRGKRPQDRTHLEGIVEKVAALLRPILEHRRIHFELMSEVGPSFVRGDADQLQQLFLNLFNNSIDAIEDSGSLSVALSRSPKQKSGSEGDFFQIEVCDTGVGIPPERLSSIFEPFYTSKEQGKGTGLGLAICREIVRLHGGQITVDSQVGHGTCITILLLEG